jgi:hypothetical protein
MPDLKPRNMAQIRSEYPMVYEALADIAGSGNRVAQQVNASPVGETPAPTAPSAIRVVAGGGITHISITHNDPRYRGIHYFAEASPNKDFQNAHPIPMGTAREWRGSLGTVPLFFRAFAQHPTSDPSPMISLVGPVSAAGGAEPPFPAGQGTGTGEPGQSGQGFGKVPYTGDSAPIRGD